MAAVLISLVTVLQSVEAQVQWVLRPANRTVNNGGQIHFNCTFTGVNDSHNVIWMSTKEPKVLFQNQQRISAENYYRVEKITANGNIGYSLVIDGAKRDDNKEYKCDHTNPDLTARAFLTVNGKELFGIFTDFYLQF